MPRSQKLQAAIDQRRSTLKLPPRPVNGIKAPESWWLDCRTHKELSDRSRIEAARMAPHAGIVGDKGVLYGG